MGFSLAQFSDVFKIRNAAGQPYLLIGGQAVNYWAERYLAVEPQLKLLQPFASEDIDFKGDADDVSRIAAQLELRPIFPAKVAMTALAGTIPIRVNGLLSNIEVVRRLPGVPQSVDDLAFTVDWNGTVMRVLDPISLLANKLALAALVPQEKRHDVEHLKIMLLCIRAFLREFLQQVESNQVSARGWLGAANQTLKLTTQERARKLGARHQIHWPDILPLAAIAESSSEKIRRFRELQLARITPG